MRIDALITSLAADIEELRRHCEEEDGNPHELGGEIARRAAKTLMQLRSEMEDMRERWLWAIIESDVPDR